jgi:plastocyanin
VRTVKELRWLPAASALLLLVTAGCFEMGDMPHHGDTGRDTRDAAVVESPGDVQVRIVNYGFDAGNLRVPAGTTVTWKNLDPVGHTATADDGAFASPVLGRDDEWSFTFAEPGLYTYFCAPHPQMKAQVEVTP